MSRTTAWCIEAPVGSRDLVSTRVCAHAWALACVKGPRLCASVAPMRAFVGWPARLLDCESLRKCGNAARQCCVCRTACPSGLRGQTQVLLAQAAWVQIPLLSQNVTCPSGLRGQTQSLLPQAWVGSPRRQKTDERPRAGRFQGCQAVSRKLPGGQRVSKGERERSENN